jgi:hypothetical protein
MGTEAESGTDAGTTDKTTDAAVEPDKAEDAEKWKALARKHEGEAKRHAKELEALKAQTMTDQEKAVAAARDEGAKGAMVTAGKRVALAEFKSAAATAGLDKSQVDGLLSLAGDLAQFVNPDTGDVDDKGIAAAIAAAGGKKAGASYDGGARGTAAPATSIDAMIRTAAGY